MKLKDIKEQLSYWTETDMDYTTTSEEEINEIEKNIKLMNQIMLLAEHFKSDLNKRLENEKEWIREIKNGR